MYCTPSPSQPQHYPPSKLQLTQEMNKTLIAGALYLPPWTFTLSITLGSSWPMF
ncbi:hypothetical protein K432DRAFT_384177 [Lepidopterella palustris CBS 459.81]|uniref:Uncharacterized protein n=1 Tax=Lepidopterella palustris CBS 459.81 TaxID=1314670 RepID=A0A8E2JDH8_9PEZI|nr:hypothetical protein K432DRAFT_384177 [Lepidopterella palustris CBS 459.81]